MFYTFLPGKGLYMKYLFANLHCRSYKAQLSSKIGCVEAGFHLKNILSGLDKDMEQWVFHPLLFNLMNILLHI